MMNFTQYMMMEALLHENVDNYQPKDGRWDGGGPSSDQNYSKYRFNVEGDDKCGTPQEPGYTVSINGDPSNGVSISFSRCNSYEDQQLGVGMSVFRGVLKALSEYIPAVKPAKLFWSPVRKSKANQVTGRVQNPEARAHVYEGWSIRNLFPDKYVGIDHNVWVRRDLYDRDYVPNGYPPIPEGLTNASSPAEKVAAAKAHKEEIERNREEIQRKEQLRRVAETRRRQEEERRREEERRQQEEEQRRLRQERLDAAINDESQNPGRVKVGDTVYVENPPAGSTWENRVGRINTIRFGERWEDDGDGLYADVAWLDDNGQSAGARQPILVRRLRPETPEAAQQREERRRQALQRLMEDPSKNPNGVRDGDDIFTHIAGGAEDNPHNNLRGKIVRIEKGRWDDDLYANVDWDDHAKGVLGHRASNSVSIKHLHKATPEALERIQSQRREAEIEQQIQRSRRRQTGGTPTPPQSGGDEFVNHPENPHHFKVGDYVKVVNHYRLRDRAGIITKIEPTSYNNNLFISVKFHGSRGEPERFWANAGYLEPDNSEVAQEIQRRAQQRQQRSQRIQQGAGGFNIGDTVTVASGLHRGKTGRIVSFRTSGQNVTAIIAGVQGNFNVKTTSLAQPTPAAAPAMSAAESYDLSFGEYFRRRLLG